MVFLMNWYIALESIAILNISKESDYYLETLFNGTKPIMKGMKFYFIIGRLDDLVNKFTKLIFCYFFLVEGILNISRGAFWSIKETLLGDLIASSLSFKSSLSSSEKA